MTNEVKEFINKLQPKDIGEEQIGEYIIAYEGFTDSCFDYLVENGLTIEETEKFLIETWNSQFGTPIETGWRNEIVTYTEPNILYSIYKANKQANSQLTPESLATSYNLKIEYTDESSGGYWRGPDTIYVSKNTEPLNYFAANWTKNDASDFYSNNSYPENVVTAAHEIAHGLFSRNPSKGHIALKAIQELGVPQEVAFESLMDMGGLYLLEPDAITDKNLRIILDNYLKDQRKAYIKSKELFEMTKEEYEEHINYLNSNRVNEELRIPMSHGRNISVYKNPTYIDMWKLEERFNEEFPRASKGEIVSRMTIDDEGNVYRWYANDAAHFQVENTLKDKYGIDTDQNNELQSYKTVLKDAIREGKNVPIENLQNYPDLLAIVQSKQADMFNNTPLKIEKIIEGKWAIYDYEVYVKEGDVLHDAWFGQIGLPTTGRAFDNITRGRYIILHNTLEIRWYSDTGTNDEFEGRLNTLIDKIGHKDLYEKLSIKRRANKQANLKMTNEDFGPEDYIPSSNTVTGIATGTLPTKLLRDSNIVDLVRTRETLTTGDFNSLKQDIKENGIQTPLTIAIEKDNRITIIDGTHRLLAAEELGIEEVPVDVRFFGGINKTHPEVLKDVEINKINKQADKIATKYRLTIYDRESTDDYEFTYVYDTEQEAQEVAEEFENDNYDNPTFEYEIYPIEEKQAASEEYLQRIEEEIKIAPHKDIILNPNLITVTTDDYIGNCTTACDSYYADQMYESIDVSYKPEWKNKVLAINGIGEMFPDGIDSIHISPELLILEESGIEYFFEFSRANKVSSQHIEIIEDLDSTRNSLKSLDKISYKMEDILNEELNIELTKKKEDIIAFMKNREQWEAGLYTSKTMIGETFRQDPNSTKNEIRWRIRSPKDFKQDTFRRWNTWAGVKAPKGIQFLIGELKDSNKKALQTIRFSKDIWTEKEAGIYWNRIKDKSGFNKTWTQADWDKEKIAMTVEEELCPDGRAYNAMITMKEIMEEMSDLDTTQAVADITKKEDEYFLAKLEIASKKVAIEKQSIRGKYAYINTSSDKFAQSKQADTTLFNNPWITVRQDNKGYVYANVPEGVAILPYKTEDDKTLYMLRSEQNSVLAPEGSLITVITGRRDDEDKEEQWYIQCAIRELEEEAGIIVTEDKITLLGEMSTNKHTKQSDMLLAIDVTGLEENEPETDGTDDEIQSYNFWVDEKGLRDFIRTSKDSYLSTITNKFFNKDVNMNIVSMGKIN